MGDNNRAPSLQVETGKHHAAMLMRLAVIIFCWWPAWSQSWSGALMIEEVEFRPQANEREQAALMAYIADLEARLGRARAALDDLSSAATVERQLLIQDIGTFTAERLLARQRAGGEVLLSRRLYRLAAVGADSGKVLVTGDGRAMLADRRDGTVWLRTAAVTERLELAKPPAAVVLNQVVGPVRFGNPTREQSVTVGKQSFTVLVLPDLPNPFALTLLADADDDQASNAMATALASLPGLPVEVTGTVDGRRYLLRVRDLQAQPIDPAALHLPDLGQLD